MVSLFEKEEKENALSQLKIDLISRFHSFSNEEIVIHQNTLNFGRYHLMMNASVDWNYQLIDSIIDRLDWSTIWKIENIKLDIAFFEKYESLIDFSSIYLSKNIEWSSDLLLKFGDKFDWSKWLITKEPLSNIENVRRFNDRLDWANVSQRINLEFSDIIIDEFKDKWDWEKLSSNRHLPITVEFIQKHKEQLDFDILSKNPACLPLIYKYPTSTRWNWENVIKNPAIIFSDETFDFLFYYFKLNIGDIKNIHPYFKKRPIIPFLFKVFQGQSKSLDYFISEKFNEYLPWQFISEWSNLKLDMEFIEKYKAKINFNSTEFIKNQKDIITTEFISQNPELFNSEHYSFYYLPLTNDLLIKHFEKINWFSLSSSEKFDWSWDFIDDKFANLNFFRLSENKGIYDRLIFKGMSKEEVISLLEKKEYK